ncbi:MAG: SHOCT domain-containing protein [Chryseotalea sp. WA131a]|nr:MAG: SHOCT domain-containing protein [Chryseotalea sp. WA131a]
MMFWLGNLNIIKKAVSRNTSAFSFYSDDSNNVSWNATFIDLKRNKSSDNGLTYEENYVANGYNLMTDPDLSEVKFTITKYTNSDRLVSAKKGSKLPLTGYCRELKFIEGRFYIVLTDNLDDKITKVTKTSETTSLLDSSEKLLKLKELLDKGIITKEEFEKEKKKILNSN